MRATEFLKLCEADWHEANQVIEGLVRPASIYGSIKPDNIRRWIDRVYPENAIYRADADLAREVEEKLFEVADEKTNCNLSIIIRPTSWVKSCASKRYNLLLTGHFFIEHDNLSWLRAAALVELMTEER